MTGVWTPRWPKRHFFLFTNSTRADLTSREKGLCSVFKSSIIHSVCPPPRLKFQILLSGPHIPKAFLNNLCNLWEENRVLYGGFGTRDYEFLFWQPLDNVAVLVDNKYSTVFLLLKFAWKMSLVPSWKQNKTKQKKNACQPTCRYEVRCN